MFSLALWLPSGYGSGMSQLRPSDAKSGIGRTAHWRGWRYANPDEIARGNATGPIWWVNVATSGPPLRATATLQPARTGRVEITALLLERLDDQALTAKDISGMRLSELQQSAQHTYGWMRDAHTGAILAPTSVAPPPKPGRSHSDEHYRTVWELWVESGQAAPDRRSAWLRQEWEKRYGEKVAWPTIVRWRDRACAMFDEQKDEP